MEQQRNLLIAIVLSMVVVFGWQFLVGVPKPPPAQTARQTQTVTQQNAAPPKPVTGAPATAAPTQVASNVPNSAVPGGTARAIIETPSLEGSINLTGGRFDDLKLRRYRETTDPRSPEIVLLSPVASEHPYFAEFGWLSGQGAQQLTPGPNTLWKMGQGDRLSPGRDIELAYDNGRVGT